VDQLSEIDKEGIDKGVVLKGMSKKGVKIAIGSPPIFANPRPDSSSKWNYWYAKRTQFAVEFDDKNKVMSTSGNYLSKGID
jgi:hypothetical protein